MRIWWRKDGAKNNASVMMRRGILRGYDRHLVSCAGVERFPPWRPTKEAEISCVTTSRYEACANENAG
jgi:hypothetical protein